MVDTDSIFAAMDLDLADRGFLRESDRSDPQTFGSRVRQYRRSEKEALELIWDGRDQWLILRGGIPWWDLAIYRGPLGAVAPRTITKSLLTEAAQAAPFLVAI